MEYKTIEFLTKQRLDNYVLVLTKQDGSVSHINNVTTDELPKICAYALTWPEKMPRILEIKPQRPLARNLVFKVKAMEEIESHTIHMLRLDRDFTPEVFRMRLLIEILKIIKLKENVK